MRTLCMRVLGPHWRARQFLLKELPDCRARALQQAAAHGQTEVANLLRPVHREARAHELLRQPLRRFQQLLQMQWASLTARRARFGSVPGAPQQLETRAGRTSTLTMPDKPHLEDFTKPLIPTLGLSESESRDPTSDIRY